jgi:hypothetical protein
VKIKRLHFLDKFILSLGNFFHFPNLKMGNYVVSSNFSVLEKTVVKVTAMETVCIIVTITFENSKVYTVGREWVIFIHSMLCISEKCFCRNN